MKYKIENSKIEKVIYELGEEYKDMLIEKILFESKEYDISQVNLPELLRYDLLSKEKLSTDKRKERRDKISAFTSIFSVFCIILGMFFLIYREVIRTPYFDIESQLALAYIFLGFIGFTLPVFMKILPIRTYKKSDISKYFSYEIVNQWKIIEARLIQLTPPDIDSSLEGMIKHLSEIKLLNESDVITIKKLLNYRNQVVHSSIRTKEYTEEEVKNLLRDSSKIAQKLQKFNEL